jgi:hypothetical protein
MSPDPDLERRYLHALNGLFRERGWVDHGEVALELAHYASSGGVLAAEKLARRIDRSFAGRNGVSKAEVARAASGTLSGVKPINAGVARPCILMLSSDPIDLDPLLIQREQREIQAQLERSPVRGRIAIENRPGLLFKDLARHLVETRPSIVHFSGHGSNEGVCAEDPIGRSRTVSSAGLVAVFGQPVIRARLKLVVLNACYSAPQAAVLSRLGVAVVGMSSTIDDDTALAFAEGMYMALGQGLSIKEAFGFGCAAITLEGLDADRVPRLLGRKSAQEAKPLGLAISPD